ncbi:Uncharacterized protein dnm_048930 [Desulfonema magnum]|uniref:Uncharacterized protein n=1 Tax=Desulfonema magnum TaxID=45655 RepID=A0A975BNL9_9BACT|nr:Uncharacterized protein dnm_048930 [Desulfonema magnum]
MLNFQAALALLISTLHIFSEHYTINYRRPPVPYSGNFFSGRNTS